MSGLNIPFDPHPLIPGPIAQTIVGSQFTSTPDLPHRVTHRITVDENNQLILYELAGPKRPGPAVLLGHGMGGCSESGFILRIASKLMAQGFRVFLMNHRGSGAGMGLCDRLWNGGSSDDLSRFVQFIVERYPEQELMVMGFSLTGNILLKYLGEGRTLPPQLKYALAVNPPIDLKVASRQISEGPWSRTFNFYYLRLMNRQVAAVLKHHPKAYRPAVRPRTIWEFDVGYTAPAFGYPSVEAYYESASASQFLKAIALPTTLLCSQDDPFIPPESFANAAMSSHISFIHPAHGGHMGYISRKTNAFGDRRWMDYFCVQWAKSLYPDLVGG